MFYGIDLNPRQIVTTVLGMTSRNNRFGQPIDVDRATELMAAIFKGQRREEFEDMYSTFTDGQIVLLEEVLDSKIHLVLDQHAGINDTERTLLRLPFTDPEFAACLFCNIPRGEIHRPGCYAEQCPACFNSILTCDCGALGLAEDMAAVCGIKEAMVNWDLQLTGMVFEQLDQEISSPFLRAVTAKLVELAPRHIWDQIIAKGREIFGPIFKPSGYTDAGTAVMTAADLVNTLGEDRTEVEVAVRIFNAEQKNPQPVVQRLHTIH